VSLRLAGAGRSIDVLDAGDPRIPTHHIAHDGIAARLVKDRDDWPFASVARADLARLRKADVRQLEWVGAPSGSAVHTVQPAGCLQFR
jgi:choline dehydrogenase-like flavoprotein